MAMEFSLRLLDGSQKICHWIQAPAKQYIEWGYDSPGYVERPSPLSFVQLLILLRYLVYSQRKQG